MSTGAIADLVSVVVAVGADDELSEATLAAWAAQREAGDYEVVLAMPATATASRDGLLRAPPWKAPFRIVQTAHERSAALRNAGVLASRGGTVVLAASDCRPAATVVAAHRRFQSLLAFPAAGIGPVFHAGALRDSPFSAWLQDGGRRFGPSFPHAALEWRGNPFHAANTSIARTVYDKVGGFDEGLDGDAMDGVAFAARLADLGVRTRYVPRAMTWQDRDVTERETLRHAWRLGGAARFRETTGAGPWPWNALVQQTLERPEAAASHGDLPMAANAPGARKRRHARLALAFVRGWHDAAFESDDPSVSRAAEGPRA
ncbi:MAG: glycosyltransferase [Betaproteobacteria bacterium]